MKSIINFFVLLFVTTQLFSQEGWYGAIDAIDENLVYVIMDDGMFLKSTNGGIYWTEYNTGMSEDFFDLVFYNSAVGFAVGTNGSIIKTINGGEDWTLLLSGTTSDLFSISTHSINSIWVVGDNGVVLNSTDQGDSWIQDNTLPIERLNSIRFRNTNTGFIAGNNGTLFHTLNGGNTWSESTINTNDDLFSISTSSNNSFLLAGNVDEYYQGYSGFKTNNNIDWTNFSLSIFGFGISSLYFRSDNLGFSSETAVALCDCISLIVNKSIDSGTNWEENCFFETTITSDQLSPFYTDIDFVSNEIGFVLSGRIILRVSDCGTTVLLNTNDINYSKKRFTIYPNPSNQTNFNIDLGNLSTDNLSIDILDINGKRVISENNLYNNISIDISNFSEGIYFVNLIEDGSIIGNQKLIVKK